MGAKVIVVTGGIGSGKSLACSILVRKGIPVYDCDSRAKALYEVYPHLKAMVVPDIFARHDALKALEDALFPLLMKDFESWRQEQTLASNAVFVAFESATVLQKDFFDNFGDYVMLVDAPEALRLERAIRRGGDPDDMKCRMALQKDHRSNPRITCIIENDGSIEELEQQIDKFLKKINYYGN